MIKGEKLIYQDNKLAYNFILGSLILNTIATILTLNSMDVNIRIGSFVTINIIFSLGGFLMAMKIKKYSLQWAYVSIVISVIQCLRSFFMPEIQGNGKNLMIILVMLVSAGFILTSSIITIMKARTRLNYINQKLIK